MLCTYSFYPGHFDFLLCEILLSTFALLVEPTNEAVSAPLVAESILVLLSRRSIVSDVDVAVLAKVLFLGDPEFAHDGGR